MAPNEKRGLKASLAAAQERIKELQEENDKDKEKIIQLQTLISRMIKTPVHVCPHEVGLEGLHGTNDCLRHDDEASDSEKAHAHANCWMVALNPRKKK